MYSWRHPPSLLYRKLNCTTSLWMSAIFIIFNRITRNTRTLLYYVCFINIHPHLPFKGTSSKLLARCRYRYFTKLIETCKQINFQENRGEFSLLVLSLNLEPLSNLTIKKPLNITNKKLSVKLYWAVLYDPKCWSLPCLVFFSTVFPTSLQVIENLLARSQKFQNPFCSVQIQWWKQELENLGTHDLLTLFLYMFCTIRLFFFKFVSLHFSYSLFLKYRWKSID